MCYILRTNFKQPAPFQCFELVCELCNMHVVKVIFLLQINVFLMDLREAKDLPVDSHVVSRSNDRVVNDNDKTMLEI